MDYATMLSNVNELVTAGILGEEKMPTAFHSAYGGTTGAYLSWPVNSPDKIFGWMLESYNSYGEVRYYY